MTEVDTTISATESPEAPTVSKPETPPAAPPKAKAKKPPPGESVTEIIESSGMTIPPEEKAQLAQIKDDEAMAAFLTANLGEGINVAELKANSIFSSWFFKQITLPPMLLTLHMDNLAQAKMAIDFCKEALKNGDNPEGQTLTPDERNGLLKTLAFTVRERGLLLKNALNLALLVQGEPPPKNTGKPPRNKPPDSLSQTNFIVQVNQEKRHPQDNQKEVEADILRKLNV